MLLYRIKAIHSSPSHVWILVFEFHLLQSVAVLVQVTFCSTLLLGLRLVSGEVRSIHFHLFLLNWISIFSSCVFLQRPSEGFVTLQVSAPNIKTVFTMVGKSQRSGSERNKYPSGLTDLPLTSFSVSPSIAIALWRQWKEETFSIASLFSLVVLFLFVVHSQCLGHAPLDESLMVRSVIR